MKKRIEELRNSMLAAGVYSTADIEEICKLEEDFAAECEEIAEQCEAEGYPSNGENYELRCAEARKCYDERIALIDSAY